MTLTSALAVGYDYNARGYLSKLRKGTSALVTYTAVDARGDATGESYGNGAATTRMFDELGRPTGIGTAKRTAKFQEESYGWRSDGLLESRAVGSGAAMDTELFAYDHLGRLDSATTYVDEESPTSPMVDRTIAYGYDRLGNLMSRAGTTIAYAATGNAGPNAATSRRRRSSIRWRVAGHGKIRMTRFFRIEDRTLFARGMPWISKFTEGVASDGECGVCRGGHRNRAAGHMRALLDPGRGTQWPDLIGCGARVGLFVASDRFVKSLRAADVRVELGGRVGFSEPGPKRLSLEDAPDYHWVDGERHRAATMDFEASGYVGVERCSTCGRRWYDIRASKPGDFPVVFDYKASSGLDLFTTDMSAEAFYCTPRVLDCAKKHRLTNVAFRPVEEGPFAKPVRYWR